MRMLNQTIRVKSKYHLMIRPRNITIIRLFIKFLSFYNIVVACYNPICAQSESFHVFISVFFFEVERFFRSNFMANLRINSISEALFYMLISLEICMIKRIDNEVVEKYNSSMFDVEDNKGLCLRPTIWESLSENLRKFRESLSHLELALLSKKEK